MNTFKPTWNKFTLSFLRKSFTFLLLHLSKQFFILPTIRPFLLSKCGVEFKSPKTVFIGTDVLFDNIKGVKTIIGANVYITTGVKILNHFPILTEYEGVKEFKVGNVIIEDNVFIGMNALIIKPIIIGKGAVIGAGAVITKDIPAGAIVIGNPAKIIGYTKDLVTTIN